MRPDIHVLKEIIARHPTPFYLYDEKGIRERARTLNKVFSWNKGYKEFFAVKALPNPTILKILREEGCGVDCASLCELLLAERCGFSGEEIMFSSNETPKEEYLYARHLNARINLDDFTHIDFLAEHGGIPEFISLRYNPGGDFRLGTFVMGSPKDAKYGMTHEQILRGVKKLQSLGAKRFGLHGFLASNVLDETYYPTMAKILFELAREVGDVCGADMAMVNLSGGIGIPYKPGDKEPDIFRIGENVEKAYREVLGDDSQIAVATELGRYMTGPFGCLVTTAIHEKDIYKRYIGVDACAANLMRPAMYGAYHHITVAGKEDAPCDHVYDVVGSLCENNDKFAIDRALPKIDIGDILILHDTGAHGHAMGYNYNGKLRSAEFLLHEDDSFSMIRRAETPEDYFATLHF
ncbi:MAG: diaminopimelate decarboxylase family protein [Christensenellales bacterium]|jgi:diaminopimelate decarboxylase